MNPLPLLLPAAACLYQAAAQPASRTPKQATLGTCVEFVSNHLNAALGNTKAMLRLREDYRRGTNLLPRTPNMALYYHLNAIVHGHTPDAALTSWLVGAALSSSYLESCPQAIRTSPDGNIQVHIQRRYPETPGIVHITIYTQSSPPAHQGDFYPLGSFTFPAGSPNGLPSVAFLDDSLTVTSPGHRLDIPYDLPFQTDRETYKDDLLARSRNGDTIAMILLANLSPEQTQSIDWLQKAADLGDTEAMCKLGALYLPDDLRAMCEGSLYISDDPKEQDLDKARQYFTLAVAAGCSRAGEYIRILDNKNFHEFAKPSEPNLAPNPSEIKQKNWRRLAGQNINGVSNLGIAKFLYQGKTHYAIGLIWGTELSTIDAAQTFLYADIGELVADLDKWRMAFHIHPVETTVEELPPGVRLIPVTWQEQRTLNLSGTPAAYLTQTFLQEWELIDGTNPDFLAILREKAAQEGATLSELCNLARPENNHSASITKLLADQGDANAMYELGKGYLSGHATYADPHFMPGIAWLEKAAAKGHPGACGALGLLYAEGLGVRKNIATARQYLQHARGIPAAERLLQSLPPAPEQ